MPEVDEQSSDDDVYAWFVAALGAEHGSAEEMAPGVIRVPIAAEDGAGEPLADAEPDIVHVHLTRAQLRSVAWAEDDVFDDRNDHVPPAKDRVLAGLRLFVFHTDETLATLRPGEHHLVLDGRELVPSVRSEPPPVRASEEPALPPGTYSYEPLPDS